MSRSMSIHPSSRTGATNFVARARVRNALPFLVVAGETCCFFVFPQARLINNNGQQRRGSPFFLLPFENCDLISPTTTNKHAHMLASNPLTDAHFWPGNRVFLGHSSHQAKEDVQASPFAAFIFDTTPPSSWATLLPRRRPPLLLRRPLRRSPAGKTTKQ